MFAQLLKNKLLFICLLYSALILGCALKENTNNLVKASQKINLQQTKSENPEKLKIQTIRGKLIYEELPRGRSVRAYKGEEFYLITNTKKSDKLVLKPSKQVSDSQLKIFENQDVEITAIYKKGSRPDVTKVACPLGKDRQCMIQGEGYEVLSIISNQ